MNKVLNFENFTIDVDSNLNQSLVKIELNNVKTLLVMNKDKVVGTVTDGDIRKAILNQRQLTLPVASIMESDYRFGSTEDDCKKILDEYSFIFVVPLLDQNRRLIDIFIKNI